MKNVYSKTRGHVSETSQIAKRVIYASHPRACADEYFSYNAQFSLVRY